jgi:hypothetical protein
MLPICTNRSAMNRAAPAPGFLTTAAVYKVQGQAFGYAAAPVRLAASSTVSIETSLT